MDRAPIDAGRRSGLLAGMRRLRGGVVVAMLYFAGQALVGAGGPAIAREPVLSEKDAETFTAVGWEVLADFDYEWPERSEMKGRNGRAVDRMEAVFPEKVRALDGSLVAITGYAIPVQSTPEGAVAFLLAAKNDLGCCFGSGMIPNHWIFVEMKDREPVPLRSRFTPATVLGRLEVGEDFQDGYVMSLYRMEATELRKIDSGS